MYRILLLVIFIHFLSCESNNEIVCNYNVTPIFSVNSGTNEISLKHSFTCNEEYKLLFDRDALSFYSHEIPDTDLLLENGSLTHILTVIESSQFVVENINGDRRFFSDLRLFEGETITISNNEPVFSIDDYIDTLNVKKNENNVSIETEYFDSNRYKVNKEDDLIRLNYLFKPSLKQKEKGYQEMILTSNWFDT
jgi:hypothetical protein